MKALIVYDTKHGNTKKVAELIGEGFKSVTDNEVIIENVNEIDSSKSESYDLVIVGSPNHVGSHTKKIKKFIKTLPDSAIKGTSYAAFDTYMSKDFEKAVKKIEKQINEIMPDLNKASSGLSIRVGGMKGPIVDEDLAKCKEYGIKLAQ
ncbi:MAG: flavodoxin family protein [Promethearchaeota archaeon]|jgi:flavodoxin